MGERTPSHEEIVRTFLESGSVNFDALGRFMSEAGPGIVQSGQGAYGVIVGHYSIRACFNNRLPAVSDINQIAGELTKEVTGG